MQIGTDALFNAAALGCLAGVTPLMERAAYPVVKGREAICKKNKENTASAIIMINCIYSNFP